MERTLKIIEPVNLYNVDRITFHRPFVEIQKNVKIGKTVEFKVIALVCENVNIGDNCFIGHGVNFINDKLTDKQLNRDSKNFLKTNISDNVKIGSNSTILPVDVNENVVIGAGSVVTKNCKKNSIYFGNPAKKK